MQPHMLRTASMSACLALACTVLPLTAVSGQKADPHFGTWRINVAKSTFDSTQVITSQTMKYEPWGDGVKVTIDIVDQRGPLHSETVFKTDGIDYPVAGARVANGTRAFTRLDERSWEVTTKVDGHVTSKALNVVSPDGKTMTITYVQGGKAVRVYDKQ